MSDFWTDAGNALATVAPTLATAIGGPLAGTATNFVLKALGLTPDTSKQQLAASIVNATPEQLLALKQADNEFVEHMAQLQLDTSKLMYDDIDSARKREASVKDYMPSMLGSIIVLGMMGTTFAVLGGYVKADSVLAGTMLGYLFSESKQVLAYYFGSSMGSDDKNELLLQAIPPARHR